jgi:hypothetical protein
MGNREEHVGTSKRREWRGSRLAPQPGVYARKNPQDNIALQQSIKAQAANKAL